MVNCGELLLLRVPLRQGCSLPLDLGGGHLSQEGFLDLFQGRRWKMLRATFLLLLFSQNPSYQNIEDIEVWYYGVACSEPHHTLNFLLLGTLVSDGIGMATGSR